MSNILDKIAFTQDDISEIIASRLEESINIEFKDARALSSENGKEISKDVSAFANSDGGVIFYGISEENHVATATSFIDGNKYNKEWLENKITTNIQQSINNLLIIPVRFDNDIGKTVYVVKIPKSGNSPHINGDKKYYRRYNFKSVPMEEYEVRDSYFRTNESLIVIENIVVKISDTNYLDFYSFNIEIQVSNKGNFATEKYRLSCNIKSFVGVRISAKNTYIITNKVQDGHKISTNETPLIFPDERLNILSFDIEIPKNDFVEFIEKATIDFYIHNISSTETISNSSIFDMMKNIIINTSSLK